MNSKMKYELDHSCDFIARFACRGLPLHLAQGAGYVHLRHGAHRLQTLAQGTGEEVNHELPPFLAQRGHVAVQAKHGVDAVGAGSDDQTAEVGANFERCRVGSRGRIRRFTLMNRAPRSIVVFVSGTTTCQRPRLHGFTASTWLADSQASPTALAGSGTSCPVKRMPASCSA